MRIVSMALSLCKARSDSPKPNKEAVIQCSSETNAQTTNVFETSTRGDMSRRTFFVRERTQYGHRIRNYPFTP
jgi:hypothetical protein